MDSVGWYLQEIGKFPLLTADQEITLGRQVQQWVFLRQQDKSTLTPAQRRESKRGERAYKKFYECNLRLVVAIAKKFTAKAQTLSLMDLISAGNIGLARAIEKYDPSRGYKFSTYAFWWVRQGVNRELHMHDRAIRLPTGAFEKLSKIKHFTREYTQQHGRFPSKTIICKEFSLLPQTLDQYINHEKGCRSLDEFISHDDDRSTMLETITDPSQDPEQLLEDIYRQKIFDLVPVAIEKLPKTHQEVIQMRFFSDSDVC